ncbi:MAG: hypothetical protein OEW09_02305 [Anaerolineae bacterium]|nr:hypothetical protein [Anaerolineae bacterium]
MRQKRVYHPHVISLHSEVQTRIPDGHLSFYDLGYCSPDLFNFF